MTRTIASLSFSGFLLLTVLLAPASHATNEFVLAVYFDDPTVTLDPPTGAVTKTRTICSGTTVTGPAPVGSQTVTQGVCRPGAQINMAGANSATFANTTSNGVGPRYVTSSDFQATVWLSAETPLPVTGITVELLNGQGSMTTAMRAGFFGPNRDPDGEFVLTLTTTPQKFVLVGSVAAGPLVLENVRLGLRVTVGTVGVGDAASPADIFIHYGSAAHPSSFSFGVSVDPGLNRMGTGAFHASLADDSIVFLEPLVDATTKYRNITAGAEVTWGSGIADQDYTLLSDGVFGVSIQYLAAAPAAAVFIGIQVKLYINGVATAGASQFREASLVTAESVATATSVDGIARYTVGLPLAGTEIAAGDEIRIGLVLEAQSPNPTFAILYGSAERPSGLFAAADTGALPPPTEEEPEENENETGNETGANETGEDDPSDNETEEGDADGNETAEDGTDEGGAAGNETGEGGDDSHAENLALNKNVSAPGELPGLTGAFALLGLLGVAGLRRRLHR